MNVPYPPNWIEYVAGVKSVVEIRVWTVNLDSSPETDEVCRRHSVAFALNKKDFDMDELAENWFANRSAEKAVGARDP